MNAPLSEAERKVALDVLRSAARIRMVELLIAKHYPEQKMRCPTHLCLGQELVPAVFGVLAGRPDIFFGNYRSHGHYLAKGGDLQALFAEILGVEGGCSGGIGGSMHLVDARAGFHGSSAIVAATVPIAAGAALAQKLHESGRITVSFFGDAAVEEGAVYEAVNFAVLHQLPLLFVCENNRLAISTPIELRSCNPILAGRFDQMGLPSRRVSGFRFLELLDAARWAYHTVRDKGTPVFLECSVSRWAAHVGPQYKGNTELWWQDPYQPEAGECPLADVARFVLDQKILAREQLEETRQSLLQEVEADYEKALASPPLRPDQLKKTFYASGLRSNLPSGKIARMMPDAGPRPVSKMVNPF